MLIDKEKKSLDRKENELVSFLSTEPFIISSLSTKVTEKNFANGLMSSIKIFIRSLLITILYFEAFLIIRKDAITKPF